MLKVLATYKNGNHRVTICDDGTKIKETFDPDADHFTHDFCENFDIHINNRCNAGCPYCHEGSTKDGEVPSLTEMIFKNNNYSTVKKDGKLYYTGEMTPFYKSLHAGTEMAIGGGNIFESNPEEFEIFLAVNKAKHILSNVTINQVHIKPNFKKIKKWVDDGLVHGIGISLVNSKDEKFWKCVDQLGENVVIHTIAGILTEKDLEHLKNRKVLILGYKHLRRGNDYFSDTVQKNIDWLKDNMKTVSETVKLMSFDCLGIEQLAPKEVLNITDDEWNTLFQGSDTDVKDADGNITCSTMYIDLVGGPKCARMSTAALDKRFSFSYDEPVETVFKRSTQGW